MIQAIALDDEPLALEVIRQLCERIDYINLIQVFTQVSKAEKYLKKFPVDLVFLDIQMPELNGVDFVHKIPKNVSVIFTTAHREFAVEGFDLQAVDYLLKPIRLERFETACNRLKEANEFRKVRMTPIESSLQVRSEYALVKIPFADILYLETMDDYIRIHRLGKKPVLTLMTMKKILAKLPEADFMRVHRSYVVPLFKIEAVRGKTISLGVTDIPIGVSYENDFFTRYIGESF